MNYAVVIGLLGAMGSGVWFFATQTAANAGIAERQISFEAATRSRLDQADKREESRAQEVAAIDNRLARIEAQLAFLVAQGTRR